jgi:hypothetical protein
MKIDAVKATYYLGPKLIYSCSFYIASPMCVVLCVSEQHTVLLRSKGGVFLVGVNEITLRLYRETEWHLESKERLGKTCMPRHGYSIRGPALCLMKANLVVILTL